jgi:quinone-modifying oxidoreductase subunit QmoC
MSERILSPDLGFVSDVIKAGGESLKKCYQCATCSVVCNVTPADKPFPRKEMVQAQWGLKSELFANPDIWLCHQCSDCTAYCPRGAKPGEVLNAVRKLSLRNYSKPAFLANMVGEPKFLLLLLAVPIALFLLYLAALGHLSEVPTGENGEIVYAKFMPVFPQIDLTFGAAAAFALAMFILGIRGYWADMKRHSKAAPKMTLGQAVTGTIKEILAHRRFEKCEATGDRKTSHLLVFYSFVALAITTTWAIIYLYGWEFFGIQKFAMFNFGESPYPLSDPMKWLGNIGAIGLLIGIGMVISNRMKHAPKLGGGSYFDWLLILVIAGIAVTGFGAELLRLADVAALAYPTYFTHLVLVFFLFAYAPFSKMAHMFYRATAMVYGKMTGRE